MANTPPSLPQLTTALLSTGLPPLSPTFLTSILSPQTPNSNPSRPPPPLTSLLATTKLRALSANLLTTLLLPPSAPSLPTPDPKIVETELRSDVFVQVLNIENIGASKWEQIELLESERLGELKKGREIIRVVADNNEEPSTAATQVNHTQNSNQNSNGAAKAGPFKLLLVDHKGTQIHAFELQKVDKIGTPPPGMGIGAKLLLKKGTKIARGVCLLMPATVTVLGGRVEALDKPWREGLEARLRAEVAENRDG